MWRRFFLSVLAATIGLCGSLRAQVIDPHAVYEDRCARCHAEHSGDFSRKTMIAGPDGELVGRETGKPVRGFLAHHRGNPSQDEIAALVEMFTLQIKTGGLYKDKCGICHKSAKRLARVRLDVRDGLLIDRVTGRNVTEFLLGHGRLDRDEARLIDDMLRWQLKTAGR